MTRAVIDLDDEFVQDYLARCSEHLAIMETGLLADAYIMKPIDLAQLLSQMKSYHLVQ